MANMEFQHTSQDKNPAEPTSWENMADGEEDAQANDGINVGSEAPCESSESAKSDEERIEFVSLEDVFDKFMQTIPEDADAKEYIKSPQSYLAFMEFISRTDYSKVGEEAAMDAMFEYSANFLDHGGILPSDADDFFFGLGGYDEIAPFYERHADTVARMQAQRLEMIPREMEGKIAELFDQIHTANLTPNELYESLNSHIPVTDTLNYLRTLREISAKTDGALDISPAYEAYREKIVPELLPHDLETQNIYDNFHLLTYLAKEFPEVIEGIEAPAIEAARLAAARRKGEHLYFDNVSDMMAAMLYDEKYAGERVLDDEGGFSKVFQDKVFYETDSYCYLRDDEYSTKRRAAIGEIIGPERQAAIEFIAPFSENEFNTRIAVLADAILRAEDPAAAKASLEKIANSRPDQKVDPILAVFAIRKLAINPDADLDESYAYAGQIHEDCRSLMPLVGCNTGSYDRLQDIALISDNMPTAMRAYRWNYKNKYVDSFHDRIASDERFTGKEAQALTENMARVNDVMRTGLDGDVAAKLQLSLYDSIDPLHVYSEEEKANYDRNIAMLAALRPGVALSKENVKNLQQIFVDQGIFDHDFTTDAAKANLSEAIKNCEHLTSSVVKDILLKFIVEEEHFTDKTITPESISSITDIIRQIQDSNSLELRRLVEPLTRELIASSGRQETDDEVSFDATSAEKKLDSIEKVFLQNNLPSLAKNLLVFSTLHPVDRFRQQFIDNKEGMVSPMLARASEIRPSYAYTIMLRDLVKSGVESNSRELRQYLQELQTGQSIMDRIADGETDFDSLGADEQTQVRRFVNYLAAGHNQTVAGRKEVAAMDAQGGVHGEEDIPEGANWLYHDMPITSDTIARINRAMGVSDRHNASDRLVRQFAYFNGYENVADILDAMDQARNAADACNRAAAKQPFIIRPGDLIKNVNGRYLDSMLENGTNCKEFLGASADSDGTPLDTDLTLASAEATIASCNEIQGNPNGNYGYVWYVIHNTPDRFVTTRKLEDQPGGELETPKLTDSRMELFKTGAMSDSHYGIRTGIGATNIDALVIDTQQEFVDKTAFRIVKNGFYIPVYNLKGELVFTPDDYDKLHAKLSGNHEYQTGQYRKAAPMDFIADAEHTRDINIDVAANSAEVQRKDNAIRAALAKKLEGTGLQFRDHIDDDLTPGFIEVSNTGSTGRGTNVPGDGDFDYIFRVDQSIITDPGRFATLSSQLLSAIVMDKDSEHRPGNRPEDIRTKHVHVDGMDDEVDIDITFVPRTDKVTYATEDSIRDYLSNFEGEERAQVVKNIIAAKKLFKAHECYKPRHAGGKDEAGKPLAQGGLGGVGVENWILQNGGSLTAATRSFLEAAGVLDHPEATPVPLQTFVERYPIWDLGANHMAEEKGRYPHDNFTANNLDEAGYQKIVAALLEFWNESAFIETSAPLPN